MMYNYYRQSGASMATRVASYRPEIQDFLKKSIGKRIFDVQSPDVSKVKKAFKAILNEAKSLPNGVQDLLSILPEISEQGTRFGYFKKAYTNYRKKGWSHRKAMLQAGIETKDSTLDFNRAGKVTRIQNRLDAFSNATRQSFYKAIETLERRGVKGAVKMVLLASVACTIHMLWGDDPELEEVPDQVKKDNYVFKVGDAIIKIKKPQDSAIRTMTNIMTLVGTMFSDANDEEKKKTVKDFFEELISDATAYDIDLDKDILENSVAIFAQNFSALDSIFETVSDTDFYYGNQITPYGTENMSPEYQYDEQTSLTAIGIGKLLKASPAKIEHIVKGYTAEVGTRTMEFFDQIIDLCDNTVTLSEKNLSEKFITKRFFVDANKNSQSVSDVYDKYDKLNTKKADSEMTGIELTEKEQKEFDKLAQAKETFSIINKQKKDVQNSVKMSGEEKREKLNELNALRTDVARYYLGKDLINSKNKKQIILYEFYPSKDTYTYQVRNGVKVNITLTDNDKKEIAQLAKEKYEKEINTLEKRYTYKKLNESEKEEKKENIKSNSITNAKNEIIKNIYKNRYK